jgi:hypothetical protein
MQDVGCGNDPSACSSTETFNRICQGSKVILISETELKNSGGHESRNPLNHYFGARSYHQLRARIPIFQSMKETFVQCLELLFARRVGQSEIKLKKV